MSNSKHKFIFNKLSYAIFIFAHLSFGVIVNLDFFKFASFEFELLKAYSHIFIRLSNPIQCAKSS